MAAFAPEITMPKASLSGMTVEALMDLRKRVDEMLLEHRAEIQKQIERMDRAIAFLTGPQGKVRVSALRGRKIPRWPCLECFCISSLPKNMKSAFNHENHILLLRPLRLGNPNRARR